MGIVDAILGQSHAIELLQSALQADRLHHAIIFHGPKGVGKLTTARALTAILLCHDVGSDAAGHSRACGICRSCEAFGIGSHPDDHVIAKELARFSSDAAVRDRKLMTIPTAVVREHLIEPVNLAPRLGHHKVFVVDEAELLDAVSQNILLKTLEEPPGGTYLILVTDAEDRLLPTIRSRCMRVPFRPLAPAVVADWLDARHPELEAAQRHWLVDFADGSLGRASLALTYDLHEWAEAILPALDSIADGHYPADLGRCMSDGVDRFARRWVDEHVGASKDSANRQAASLMWSMIARHARDKLAQTASASGGGDPVATEALLEPWLNLIDAIGRAEYELRCHVNLGIVMDHFASMAYRAVCVTG